MVETIEKIRLKISKLLVRIATLEKEAQETERSHEAFKESLAMKIIHQKDAIIETYGEGGTNPWVVEQLTRMDSLLMELEVEPLSAPLDQMADFIEVKGYEKADKKRNGTVSKVLKKGYLFREELLRPTHVMIVRNDD